MSLFSQGTRIKPGVSPVYTFFIFLTFTLWLTFRCVSLRTVCVFFRGLYIICYVCGIVSKYDWASLLLAEAETATPLSRSAPNADRSREAKEVERDATYIADDIPVPGRMRSRPSSAPTKKGYLHIDAQRSICDSLVPSAEIRHPHCDRSL